MTPSQDRYALDHQVAGLIEALEILASAATVGGISAGERKGLARAALVAQAALREYNAKVAYPFDTKQ